MKASFEMAATGRSNILARDAWSDLWRHTLAQIPSIFGRLVYLSSLRIPHSARYRHDGLSQIFGEDEANRALRKSHNQAFAEWLNFDIEQQKADVDLYLSALFTQKITVLKAWINLTPYRSLIPNSAKTIERKLYLADFQAILELLKNEYAVGDLDPGA